MSDKRAPVTSKLKGVARVNAWASGGRIQLFHITTPTVAVSLIASWTERCPLCHLRYIMKMMI